jgi:chromosome partitioning protein
LIRLYNNVKNNVNHELKIEGILMNMVEKEDETSLKIEDEIRKSFPDLVFRTTIPESREVKESPCHGTPVLLQNIACTGSRSYLNLAGEIIRKTKDHSKGADV